MSQPIVVLAHAPHAEPAANLISDALSRIGFSVDKKARAATRRAQAAKIEAAHRIVLVSSRGARLTPAMRLVVQRARAKGRLVCISLDAAHPARPLPRSPEAWRKALAKKPRLKAPAPAKARRMAPHAPTLSKPQSASAKAAMEKPVMSSNAAAAAKPHPIAQIFGLLAVLIALTLLAGAALHQSDPRLATRIDAMIAHAQTLVGKH